MCVLVAGWALGSEPAPAHGQGELPALVVLHGMWALPGPIQNACVRPPTSFDTRDCQYNLGMAGRDMLSLELQDVAVEGAGLRFTYSGVYTHHHTWGRSDPNDDHRVNSCASEWIEYPLTGTVVVGGDSTPRVELASTTPATTQWAHGASIHVDNSPDWGFTFWSPFVSDGAQLRLHASFGESLVTAVPPGCDVELVDASGYERFSGAWLPLDLYLRRLAADVRTGNVLGTTTATRGTVTLYEQKVPASTLLLTPGEPLPAEHFHQVATAAIGSDGEFSFYDVPLARLSDGSGGRVVRYAVTIHGAETPLAGLPEPIYFAPALFLGVVPVSDRQPYALTAEVAISAKRSLIAQLLALGKNHYKADEDRATAHLDALVISSTGITDAQREGVQRAVWAERIVLEGAAQADALFEVSTDRLATFLGDLFDELVEFQSQEVRAARTEYESLREAESRVPAATLAQWRLERSESMRGNLRQRGLLNNGRQSWLAEQLKTSIEVGQALASAQLSRAGLLSDTGTAVLNGIVLITLSMLDLVATQSVVGTLREGLKAGLGYLAKGLRPVLFDNRFEIDLEALGIHWTPNVDLLPSYTSATQPYIETAVDQMVLWSVADPVAYAADSAAAAAHLNAMVEEGVRMTEALLYIAWLADTLDASESVLDIAGAVYKPAAAAAKLAKVGKFVNNFALSVGPAAQAFALVAPRVEQGVALAYGLPYDPGGQGGAPGAPACTGTFDMRLLDELDASYRQLAEATDAMRQALEADDLGSAADSLWSETGPYRVASDRAHSAVLRLQAHLAAADPAGAQSMVETEELLTRLRGAIADELNSVRRLDLLLVDTLAGRFDSPADPDYVAARDEAVLMLDDSSSWDGSLAIAYDRNAIAYAWTRPGVAICPATAILSFAVRPPGSDSPLVTASPQQLTAELTLAAVGTQPVAGASVRLAVQTANGTATIEGQPVANVGALDVDGTATLTWTIAYAGPVDASTRLLVTADLEENGARPTGFAPTSTMALLTADPAAFDADLDGIPDADERVAGLDPDLDDADEDRDADGLSNIEEWRLGTTLDKADSDGDGLADGEECSAGEDGWRTDPLQPDSDGDGVADGQDGAPVDPFDTTVQTPQGEPLVALEQETISMGLGYAFVPVRNGGAGELHWEAVSANPVLLQVVNASGEAATPLILRTTVEPYRFSRLSIPVAIVDGWGATRDVQTLMVTIEGERPAPPDTPEAEDTAIPCIGPATVCDIVDDVGTGGGRRGGGCGCVVGTARGGRSFGAACLLVLLAWVGLRRGTRRHGLQ